MTTVQALLLILLLAIPAVPAHAGLMQVMDINFSSTAMRLEEVAAYSLRIGDLSPLVIGGTDKMNFRGMTALHDGYGDLLSANLTPILTRTHVLPEPDQHWSDHDYMAAAGYFVQQVTVRLEDYSELWYVLREDIPDLSAYSIKGYYLSQLFFDDGITTNFHIELLANCTPTGDSTPVPEPSTLLMVPAGFAGLGFLRWKKRSRKVYR